MDTRQFSNKQHSHRFRKPLGKSGFTLIELLIVVGIMGVITAALYPNLMNSIETRSIENEARDILTTLQRTKFQAVREKINHRLRFEQDGETNLWQYVIEREELPDTWTLMQGFIRREIPSKFNVTVDLPVPELAVVFSPLGIVMNPDLQHNTIILQSERLDRFNQPDQREIRVFSGGSVRFVKSES